MCSICLDSVIGSPTTTLKCNHTFHVTCFDQWSSRSRTNYITCPNCRTICQKPYAYSNPPHFIILHSLSEEAKTLARFPSRMEVIILMKYISLIISIISIFDGSKSNKNWVITKFNFTVTLGLFILSFLLKCIGIS